MHWDLLRLLPGHGWLTRTGHKTIVLDRGAVQFDFPRSWAVVPAGRSVSLFDRSPPGDTRLEVSYFRLPPVDPSEVPFVELVDDVTSGPRESATCGPLREEIRRGIELVWREVRFAPSDPDGHMRFRAGVARAGTVICLITFEFRDAARSRAEDAWELLFDSLVLDRVSADPRRGPSPTPP